LTLNSSNINHENEVHLNLLNATVEGDEEAINRLYSQFNRKIYAFALRRLSAPHLAEEVVVETMFEVWKNAKKFAGHSKVSTWLLGIARYKVLDKMRQRGIQQTREVDAEDLELEDEQPSAFEEIAKKQQSQHVADCLKTLPDDQRECMHLVFYEELSLVDIAEIQQCPANTIKTRMFHARKKMKDCIEKQISWSQK
jgi:RNA polymerase sigma-70 factor, ECF subfamily